MIDFLLSDGVHFRWHFQDLGHPLTDSDETMEVYRVDHHIFHFRSEVDPGNRPSPYDIGIRFQTISERTFTPVLTSDRSHNFKVNCIYPTKFHRNRSTGVRDLESTT